MAGQSKTKTSIRNNSNNNIHDQILSLNGNSPGHFPAAIHPAKQLARETFEKTGLPGPKNEEYKYTDIAGTLKRTFNFNHHAAEPDLSDIEHFRNHPVYKEKVYIAATVNGKMIPELCVLPGETTGLTVLNIEEASEKLPETIGPIFGQIAKPETDGYVSMNTMLTNNGIFIRVKENAVPEYPVVILNFTDSSKGEVTFHPHNIFISGKNSEIRIIEINEETGPDPAFRNSVTEILADQHARLHLYKLQNFAGQNIHVDNTSIEAREGTSVNVYTFSFNGRIIRNNLKVALMQERSESHLYGLYVANNKSLIDNHTVVDHKAANCLSNELYKGIMDDYSTGVFNGKIYVRPDAQKTNAFQSNHNILLSKTAKIDAKPQLEIWADDVKCTHGCTTGQINKEHLFYMRSRGISEADARTLLLQAFASDILNKVEIPFLKAKISSLIKTRLHPGDH